MPCFQNIERGEYWIIDAVWQTSLFLSAFTVENLEEAFNKKGHNLTYSELVDTFCRLFQSKYLIAHYSQDTQESPLKRGTFIPNKEEVIAGLKGNLSSNLCYKLTAKGGARWESVSKPNWHLYYTPIHIKDMINDELFIAGGSRGILEKFLAYQISHPFRTVNINSIKWEILEPWEATYWKTLPVGYQVSYIAEDIPLNSQEDIIKADMFNFCFFQWQNANKWYTEYF